MARPWTPDEIETARLNYADHPTHVIAFLVSRSERAVYMQADKMGLRKSAAYFASDRAGRIQKGRTDPRMQATQFKPGQVPANKGLRRPGWAPGRMAATQFKKGRKPEEARNYQPIGTLRVCRDGILQRKVTDDPSLVPAQRWRGVHTLVWESANGPLPAGHVVVFKPGRKTLDPERITPDAVECITRAENMRRNSYHTRYPKEVAQLIQLRGALNRKLNRRGTYAQQAQ